MCIGNRSFLFHNKNDLPFGSASCLLAVYDTGRPFAAFLDHPDCLFAETACCRTADRLYIADGSVFVDNKLDYDGVRDPFPYRIVRISEVLVEVVFPGYITVGVCRPYLSLY